MDEGDSRDRNQGASNQITELKDNVFHVHYALLVSFLFICVLYKNNRSRQNSLNKQRYGHGSEHRIDFTPFTDKYFSQE
jgi:hypothetical protein